MYNSQSEVENQYQFAQARPNTYDTIYVPLRCNGRRLMARNWYSSRQEHRHYANKYARSTQHLLQSLPPEYRICKGAVKMPDATIDDWRKAKSTFARHIARWKKSTGWDVQWIGKVHITWDRQNKRDDIHYDWILYHNIPRADQWETSHER
jgi:hypothetical protein